MGEPRVGFAGLGSMGYGDPDCPLWDLKSSPVHAKMGACAISSHEYKVFVLLVFRSLMSSFRMWNHMSWKDVAKESMISPWSGHGLYYLNHRTQSQDTWQSCSSNVDLDADANAGYAGLAHNLQKHLKESGRALLVSNRTKDKPEVHKILDEGATWCDSPAGRQKPSKFLSEG